MFVSTYNLPAKPQQCSGWHQSCCSYLIDCCSWASNEMDGGVISDIRSRQLCLNTASQYLAWMSTEYGLHKAWCPACDWLQMRHWRQAVVTRPRTKTKQMLKCSVAALVLCYHWVWQFDSFVIQCPWFCSDVFSHLCRLCVDIHCLAKVWDEEDWNDDEPDTPVKGEPNTLYMRKSKRR